MRKWREDLGNLSGMVTVCESKARIWEGGIDSGCSTYGCSAFFHDIAKNNQQK